MNNTRLNLPKFWNLLTDKGAGKAVLTLEGEICAVPPKDLCGDVANGVYYTNKDFRNDLAQCEKMQEVVVNINSVGGDLYQGIAIHNALASLPCKVTTVIQGIAASAASIIFCAGKERLVYPGSVLMAHGVMSFVDYYDYVNEHGITELQAKLKTLKKSICTMNRCVADIYAAATGKSQEDCLALISDDAQTYMSGADAIAEGFATGYAADGYAPELRMVACAGKRALYSNKRLLSEDFHAPENAAALGIVESQEAPEQETETMEKTQTETVDEVKENAETTAHSPAPAPTAVSEADIKAAIVADRKRIGEIERIANKFGSMIPVALVETAKYGNDATEPMTSEQFALAALNAINPGSIRECARAEELAPANSVGTSPGTSAEVYTDTNGVLRASNGVRADIAAMISKSNI